MTRTMTGFTSSGPRLPATTPASDPGAGLDIVAGDGWFPGVSIATARATLRIPESVTAIRVRDALRSGMLNAMHELRAWRAIAHVAGAAGLADVPGHAGVLVDTVDGVPKLELLYQRAVFAFAAADLVDTHHDISATNDGKDRAETRALAADEHRRNATHAIRDMLGTTRTAVELI